MNKDAHLENVPHVMYRFYDDERRLLYIGITSNLGPRLDAHLKDKPWFKGLAYIAVGHHDTRTAALEAERRAIVTEQPIYNVAHSGGEGDPFLGQPRYALHLSARAKVEDDDRWNRQQALIEDTLAKLVEVITVLGPTSRSLLDEHVPGPKRLLYAALERGVTSKRLTCEVGPLGKWTYSAVADE